MKYIATAIFLIASLVLFSQPKIDFKNTTHDYGDIKEDGGMAETEFVFTNTGNQPLIINNVRATCGCTTPDWTRDPVLPGKTGKIKVGYNPKNRPGAFSKNVNIYSNTQPGVTVLTIRGNVSPREKTIEELYPRVMGPVRLKSNYANIGSIMNTQSKSQELEYINTSETPVKIEATRVPSHITVSFEPETVKPGDKGKILVNYDATKKEAYGQITDRAYLKINDESHNNYSIGISTFINEDFSKLSAEELEKAPKASFDSKVFDFGTLKEGEKVTNVFKLTNEGKSDLIIRNVKASCGCTAVKHENVVKPGQTIDLTVEFNSRNKRNRQNKSITVITNDPKNSTTVLRVMGTVN
ncbi:MAG: DUF1573 domain-containing protein [Prolixibacteraceae bacterium]|jgi:hypothetical protein|nr:DUF1573 domain-containing protein [Prolixibacteraceae bacterium]